MPPKLVPMDQAAAMLGMSVEDLGNLRSNNEIFGYRDGASWKFKMSELERVARSRDIELNTSAEAGDAPTAAQGGGSGVDDDLDELVDVGELDLDAETADDDAPTMLKSGSHQSPDEQGPKTVREQTVAEEVGQQDDGQDDEDSVLVSDQQLGASASGGGSTIIGKDDKESSDDSDIQLSDVPDLDLGSAGGSGIGGDLELVADSGHGGSDVSLVPGGSDVLSTDKDDSPDTAETSDLPLEEASDNRSPSDLKLDSGPLDLTEDEDDLALGEDDDLEIVDATQESEELELGEDDEFVFEGPDSDVTRGAGDSGIGLKAPADSGISLDEEPLELGGSAVDSLELPEDEVLSLEEEVADQDAATQLKADDDFLLTPVDDDTDDESASGSQVIALDSEESFEDEATLGGGTAPATLLEEVEQDQPDLMEVDDDDALAGPQPADMPGDEMGLRPTMERPEAPYSIWNVLSLALIVIVMATTSILMVDLMRSMWGWEQNMSWSNSIMESVVKKVFEK